MGEGSLDLSGEAPGNGGALPVGWQLVRYATVDSTNEEIRRRIKSAVAPFEGLAVMADNQTAGHGRRGRPWQSPPGNLLISFLLRGGDDLQASAQVSFVAAIALAEAVAEMAPSVATQLKWPNDVRVHGRKLSGILLETEGPWLILGIGVNVIAAPPDEAVPYPAISLARCGATVSTGDLAAALARHLDVTLHTWRQNGFTAIRQQWLARAEGLGQPIIARLQTGVEIPGRFVDLDADGALLLAGDDGAIQRIIAADVHFPPP